MKWTLIAAVVLIPAAGLAWLVTRPDDPPDAIAARTTPLIVQATSRNLTDEQAVAVAVTRVPGRELRAPSGGPGGTVTRSAVIGPGAIRTGQVLYQVDGVARFAAASAEPFFRPLEFNDRGPDVAALNGLLVGLGHLRVLPEPADRFTATTAAAVELLAASLGLTGEVLVFDPAWVVWLPSEPFEAGEWLVVAGGPAPSPGSVIGREAARLSSATLGAANPQLPLVLDPAIEWVVIIGQERFALAKGSLAIAAADLARLQALLKAGQDRLDGVVRRAEPLQAVAVPSTSVQTGRDGALCVWVPDGAGYRAVIVEPTSARSGVTNLRRGLAAGADLLANPATVLKEPACPSTSSR